MEMRESPNQASIGTQPTWKIKLLYDGLCPLCLREVRFLQQRDAKRGIVAFVDITDLDYEPADHGGVSFEDAMGRIHAVLPDNSILQDVAVFRRVYAELGMGWVYAATQWPIVGSLADQFYRLWANWRLALTGRSNLALIVADRQRQLEARAAQRCRLVK
jgi:predicted DCC family thiol-disulfide oxidoreductase YuxK